jgi:hypothetical protein
MLSYPSPCVTMARAHRCEGCSMARNVGGRGRSLNRASGTATQATARARARCVAHVGVPRKAQPARESCMWLRFVLSPLLLMLLTLSIAQKTLTCCQRKLLSNNKHATGFTGQPTHVTKVTHLAKLATDVTECNGPHHECVLRLQMLQNGPALLHKIQCFLMQALTLAFVLRSVLPQTGFWR